MRILLNFLPLKSGGGVQVGLDVLYQVQRLGHRHRWVLVATEGTPFAALSLGESIEAVHIVANSLPARLWFEWVGWRRRLAATPIDAIFTLFGPPLPRAGNIPNIAGFAYGLLLYPEAGQFHKLSITDRILLGLVDWYRVRRAPKADSLIFETEAMRTRFVDRYHATWSRTYVVKPAPSSLVRAKSKNNFADGQIGELPDGFLVLLLSSYRPHKNIDLLPRIARQLSKSGTDDVFFIVTLSGTDYGQVMSSVMNDCKVYMNKVINIGPVKSDQCIQLYFMTDAVILPSSVESFSNTIAESWAACKPLLISDLDWASDACGEAALYFSHCDADDAARKIMALRTDTQLVEQLVASGTERLATLNTPEQRFLEYQAIIEEAVHPGRGPRT